MVRHGERYRHLIAARVDILGAFRYGKGQLCTLDGKQTVRISDGVSLCIINRRKLCLSVVNDSAVLLNGKSADVQIAGLDVPVNVDVVDVLRHSALRRHRGLETCPVGIRIGGSGLEMLGILDRILLGERNVIRSGGQRVACGISDDDLKGLFGAVIGEDVSELVALCLRVPCRCGECDLVAGNVLIIERAVTQ